VGVGHGCTGRPWTRAKKTFFFRSIWHENGFLGRKKEGKKVFLSEKCFFFLYNKLKKVFWSKKCFYFLYNTLKKVFLWSKTLF
jgi:hypothetical protein